MSRRFGGVAQSPPRGRGGDQSIFRPSYYELPLRMPSAALGARRLRTADAADHRNPPQREIHHPDPETEEAEGGGAAVLLVRRGSRAFHRVAGLRPHVDRQRGPHLRRAMAQPAQPEPVAGDGGNRPPVGPLAKSRIQQRPAVLLPGGGRGNRDLAHRGRVQFQKWPADPRRISRRRTGTRTRN